MDDGGAEPVVDRAELGPGPTDGCTAEPGRPLVGGIPELEGSRSSPTQRAAPSLMSFSRIGVTCSMPRPVTATISDTAQRPSMRDKTKPSIADRGSVRTSSPGTSSGTLSCSGFTGSTEYRVLLRNGAFPTGDHPARQTIRVSSRAFCVCSRFSASSHTRERGPSITSADTSSPRCAGRQWRKMPSFAARDIRAASTV